MAVKSKVSKLKKNNKKRNTSNNAKQTPKSSISKKPKNCKKPVKPSPKRAQPVHDGDPESDNGEDMLEMVDEEDLDFLKNAIVNRSYRIYNNIKYSGPKAKKRKKEEDDDNLENQYENQENETQPSKVKSLLPIKTQRGIVPQMIEAEEDKEEETTELPEENEAEENDGEFTLEDNGIDISKPISATQLLAQRNDLLRQRKIHIGTLSAGLLENPEEKVMNLKTLLTLMDEETPEVYYTVRKLVIVSLLEVFKDILPSYEIKDIVSEGVKLKKDTLKLKKYEDTLLLYYKKFLQKLEKHFSVCRKKGSARRCTEEEIKLAELSIQCMCELLEAHPYFNYAQNIAQSIVPFLNHSNRNMRSMIKRTIQSIFKTDRKEELTLKILRIVNHYLKNHSSFVHTDMLEILLVLNLKGVNLDQEKEQNIKQKKMMAKKARILQLSRKEKKRKKKLQMLEKELLETKAEESQQVKQKNLTEITKILFNIYFRILKNSENSQILSVCLEGLAKFAHCINLEYYVDIVNVLSNILNEDWLGYKEKLHCVQTIFTMLSGQGEAINLDPTRFYNILYKDLPHTNAARNDSFAILLKTLNEALIKRRKKITNRRMVSFTKRLVTLSMQLLHNECLGCLGLVRTIMQLNRSVDILLDTESSLGEGKFDPLVDDPEYSNASSTALYELILLRSHYHPVANRFAKYIASGVPTTGQGSLPPEYGKLTTEQLYTDFDMSQMAFNPPVPVPRKAGPKSRPKRFAFANSQFEEYCRTILKTPNNTSFWITC